MPGLPRSPSEGPDDQHAPVLSLQVSLDRRTMLLWAIVAAQAVWLAIIMLGGWYSGPDLGNLAAATGEPLSWHYLTTSLGGHLGIPARFLYWLLNRAAPLNWPFTVALRLVFQAVGTVLLFRLLDELVGRRSWILAVVGLYAFSPLLVPGTAVLSSGIGLPVGQALFLAGLLAHVRYTRTGRLKHALLAGLLLFAMVNIADAALPTALVLPVISLGFLHQGTVRQRLAASARRWPGWLALGAGAGAFIGLYSSQGNYAVQKQSIGLGDALDVVGRGWFDVLGPTLLGGPLRFHESDQQHSPLADPPIIVSVLGQVALLVLVVLAVRRTGRRALVALALPVLVLLSSLVLTATGRLTLLGDSLAYVLRYSYYLPVALAIGVTLAFARTPEEGPQEDPVRTSRAGLVAVSAVLLASLVSSGEFAHGFWRNPSHDFVNNLASTARTAGPTADVYDSAVPNRVSPFISPNHFVSDLLALSGVPVTFGGSASDPLLATEDGHLVPSAFLPTTDVVGKQVKSCGTFVRGAGRTTLTFGDEGESREWYLRLELYEPHANTVLLEVRDAKGKLLALHSGGSSFRSTESLVVVSRRVQLGEPATLTVVTTDPATNFCLVHAYLGAPLPRR